MSGAEGYALRKSQRLALAELVSKNPPRLLAQRIGIAIDRLQPIADFEVLPTNTERCAVIGYLVRNRLAGRSIGDRSDVYGPGAEGYEQFGAGGSTSSWMLAQSDRMARR